MAVCGQQVEGTRCGINVRMAMKCVLSSSRPEQDFSPSALLAFWAGRFLVAGLFCALQHIQQRRQPIST